VQRAVNAAGYPANNVRLVANLFMGIAMLLISVSSVLVWRMRKAAAPLAGGGLWGRTENILVAIITILLAIMWIATIVGVTFANAMTLPAVLGVAIDCMNRFPPLLVLVAIAVCAFYWFGRPNSTASPLPALVIGWGSLFLYFLYVYPSMYSVFSGRSTSCMSHGAGKACTTDRASSVFALFVLVLYVVLLTVFQFKTIAAWQPHYKGAARVGYFSVLLILLGLFIYGAAWMNYSTVMDPFTFSGFAYRTGSSHAIFIVIATAFAAHAIAQHAHFDEEVAITAGDSTLDIVRCSLVVSSCVTALCWATWVADCSNAVNCSVNCAPISAIDAGDGIITLSLTVLTIVQHLIYRSIQQSVLDPDEEAVAPAKGRTESQ